MDTNQYLIDYYNQGGEDGRLARRHSSVEFLTTMRYIERYLKPGDRVIEVGAGTGRYSHALARMGYAVDAVELVDYNIEVFQQSTQTGETVTVTQGNALDLSGFPDGAYDVTLLLGPLYHLYNAADKHRAISEAIRVTKPGGIVFAAYIISDAAVLDSGFKNRRWSVSEFVEKGFIHPQTFAASSEPDLIFELVRKEDIDALMEGFPVTRLHYVAADGYAEHMRDALAEMDGALFELYLRYHFATCERPDMAGLSHHVLDIFKKDEDVAGIEREIAYYNALPVAFDGHIELPELYDGVIRLVCTEKQPADPVRNWVPGYNFAVCKGSEKVGGIGLRIGYGGGPHNSNLYYGGQIGYGIDEKYRGNGYAARACRLLRPVAMAHGMTKLLITNDIRNTASRRVCEKIGARLVRAVRLPEWTDMYQRGHRFSNVFEWDVEQTVNVKRDGKT
jgi:predicted acetyltransferase/cyclopropane fatty-acyl-phospholipid synthase-like methyltransferase